jgi:predicted DsbA family dithiol-disulfide isomerase
VPSDVERDMRVDIWSDVVCPWCYIGKRRFEAALGRFPHREQVEVSWRAFELDPTAAAEHPGAYADRLAEKYGTRPEAAEQMIAQLTATAAEEGLDLLFDRARPGNTRDAHRLMHLAATRGKQDLLAERLFRASFVEGEPVGLSPTLVRLATDVGLDADEVWRVLDSEAFGDAVQAEESAAADLGIRAVPFFVIDGRYGVSGAQPAEMLLQALEQAWEDRSSAWRAGREGDSCAV